MTGAARDALVGRARAPASEAAVGELSDDGLPLAQTGLLGREADLRTRGVVCVDSLLKDIDSAR